MEYGVLIIRRDGRLMGQPVVLRLGSTAIGRDASNDVVLPDPDVSRFHARIICTSAESKIRDTDSTNGTALNGQKLKPQVEYKLNHSDTISIGPFVITYQRPQRRAVPPDVAASTKMPVGTRPPPSVAPPVNGGAEHHVRPLKGRSSYWDLLPPFYEEADESEDEHEHGVMNGLLRIFESILAPLDRTIDQIYYYFDPRMAPAAMLPWLAFWVDLALDESWPEDRRRALISRAAELYRWRGTRKGMREYIQIYTDIEPIIVEPGREGLRSGEAQLRNEILRILQVSDVSQVNGALADLVERPLAAHVFRIILVAPKDIEIDDRRLRQIIEAEKPAHTGYELEIFQAAARA